MEAVNIQEILIVNGIGVLLMLLLRATWIGGVKQRQVGDRLYDAMINITLAGCILETITFLIDRVQFPGCRAVSYITNGLLFMGTITVGFLWCMYVDFQQNNSPRRLRATAWFLLLPVVIVYALSLSSMLGSGMMFSISQDNVYHRGPFATSSYVLLFFYYAYSLYLTTRKRRCGLQIQFFPVLYFIIPCVLGTVIQGIWYGITAGWTSVAISMVLVHMQLQSMNAYMDSLSGLYNRR